MTGTLNEKQEQRISSNLRGCLMPTATRYDFEVPFHRFTVLLTRRTCLLSDTWLMSLVRVGVIGGR